MSIQAMKLICRFGIALLLVLGCSRIARAQFVAGTWAAVTNAPSGINPSTCLLLTDGTVMCQAGPGSAGWVRLTPDINGSYENGKWTTLNNAPTGTDGTDVLGVTCAPCQWAPEYYASAVLPDGQVVFIGGEYDTNSTPTHPAWSTIGFLFNPTANGGAGSWSAQLTQPWGTYVNFLGDTVGAIGDAQSIITQQGTMLVANTTDSDIGSFNETTLTFTALSPTGTKLDSNDEEGWTILPNGTLLSVDAGTGNSYEIYDPVANAWSHPTTNTTAGITLPDVSSNCSSEELGPAVARPDGTVLQFSGNASGENAVYTIATGTWAVGPVFPSPTGVPDTVADGPASLLVNGDALVMASPGCQQTSPGPPAKYSTFNSPSHIYEYYPMDGLLHDVTSGGPSVGSLDSYQGRMLLLPSGHVLVTHDGDNTDVWTYAPHGGPMSNWAPAITSVPTEIGQGETYSISGTLFNGFSQGATYGDDAQMNTNYPLVRITNIGTNHVFYARTHGHSRMGVESVGDTTTIVTTNFDVPTGTETGASTLVVVTNGIPSAPVDVNVGLGSALAYTGATSGDYNDAVTVQAQLTSGGSPVSTPETVTFVLGTGAGTETCSGTTNPSGVASCSITPNQAAGSYTITATFGGDSTYGASSTSTAFTILLEDTAVAFTGASATNADYDDAATVQAVLTDPTDGTPIFGKTITFALGSGGGTETCSASTNGSGLASCSITPNQAAGPYSITATFAGDAFYASSSTLAPFTINKEEDTTKFTASSPTVIASGHSTTFSAILLEDGVTPIQGRTITITIGTQSCLTGPTDPTGTASCSILISTVLGPGTVTASFAGDPFYLPSSATEPVIVFAFLNSGSMIIGNLDGNPVEFWGAQWAKSNSFTGGPAPNSFKGFANTAPETCGGGWTSNPGNSSGPPSGPLPSYMGVIVSSTVVQSGSVITGDVPKIVVVQTYPGYAPDPGHAGTGTVVAVYCGH
jgi:hypothetical protein